MHEIVWKKAYQLILALLVFLFSPFFVHAELHGEVTSPFGERTNPISNSYEYHPGIDIAAPEGSEIPSLSSGTVGSYYDDQGGGYGITVEILNDDGSGTFLYAHLQGIAEGVSPGSHISAGQPIGYIGSTGYSTGPHLHLGYQPIPGELTFTSWENPAPFVYSSPYWAIDGNMDANTIGGKIGSYVQKIIPNIDVDFQTYFSPSEALEKMMKGVLEKILPALDLADKHLIDLLTLLCILDFTIFCMLGYIAKRRANPNDMILRFMRYGFFFFLFTGWHKIVSTFFVPMIEDFSTVISGETFSESTFFHFDILFTSLAHILAPFMHVTSKEFGLIGSLVVMAALWIIIFLTIILTFYVMYKLIVFYLLCVFGVLGIPVLLFDSARPYGTNMVSSILCAVFDLIMTSWIYVFVVKELSSLNPLDGNSISGLLAFVCIWGVFVFFVPSLSNAFMRTLSSLWSGWRSQPLQQ